MHITIALALTLAPTLQDTAEEFDAARFGIELFEMMERHHENGFAGILYVVSGDEELFAEGFGFADRENEVPWTKTTHATVGSITKQFTGAAIMKLVDMGKLSVEDDIAKFYPAAPDDKRAITVHQMLTHSSGLAGLRMRDNMWIDRDDFVLTILAAPLRFAPGERYEYSNTGFSMLAAIVELVSGQTYEDFLTEELFAKADMKETGYLRPEFDRARLVVGYPAGPERWGGTMLDDMYFEEGPSWVLVGNGGMYSTPVEMHRWVRALHDHRVLSEGAVEQLWTKHIDESNGRGSSFYGYGWSIFDARDGSTVITHNGDDGGGAFFNDVAWIPEHEIFVMLQTNTYIEDIVEDILLDVVNRLTAP